jgi:uncharacterized membrane protein
MSPTLRPMHDEPAKSDPLVTGLSEAIGGPLGDHAVRSSSRGPSSAAKFWTPLRIILALTCLVLAFNWMQKAPCRDGQWVDLKQYKYMCYTDVLALYYAEHLSDGAVPYADHPVEYPVVTGIFMGAIGLPVHALREYLPDGNEGRTFYDFNAIALGAMAVAAAGAIWSVRRRRQWDAALFALAPAMWLSATVNWDLLVVGLTAIALAAWAKRQPLIAGPLMGLAIGAKFYPLLILGPMLLLAVRSKRYTEFLTMFVTAALTWLVVNGPIAALWWKSWSTFFAFNSQRGIDWGTFWYIGAHFPRGNGTYGFSFFAGLDSDPTHSDLNTMYMALFALACVCIAVLTLTAKERPRLGQLAFLVVAAFLIVGKVWSQQYVLWLIPLAVIARPRWGAFLAWQAAEVIYFVSFYGELMGASGKSVFPEGVFVLASSLRLITLCVLVGFVVRDIVKPRQDVVRRTYGTEDPDGGAFNDGADSDLVSTLRRFVGLPTRPPAEPASAPVPEPVPVTVGAGEAAEEEPDDEPEAAEPAPGPPPPATA